MRQFGRIETAIWQNPKFRSLSEGGQKLYLYLIACPHGNAIGCFRLPYGYAQEDLNWSRETLSERFDELLRNGLVTYSKRHSIVRLTGWFGHNVIENRNVAKGAVKALMALPDCSEKRECFKELKLSCASYEQELWNDFETVAEGFRNTSPYPEPEPEIEPEPETESADAPPPLQVAVDDWNQLASELGLPKVQSLNDQRRRALRARLKECGGIDGWRYALGKIRGSSFLTGSNDRGWKADFDFVLLPKRFTKLMEGGYDGQAKQSGWDDIARAAAGDWDMAESPRLVGSA